MYATSSILKEIINMYAIDVWVVDEDCDNEVSYFGTFESGADCAKWMWSNEYESGNKDIRFKLYKIMNDESRNGELRDENGDLWQIGYAFEHPEIRMQDRMVEIYDPMDGDDYAERYAKRVMRAHRNIERHLKKYC